MSTKKKQSVATIPDRDRAPTREEFTERTMKVLEDAAKVAFPLSAPRVSVGISHRYIDVNLDSHRTALGLTIGFTLELDTEDAHAKERWSNHREKRYYLRASIGNGATHRPVSEAQAFVSLMQQVVNFAALVEARYSRVTLYIPKEDEP